MSYKKRKILFSSLLAVAGLLFIIFHQHITTFFVILLGLGIIIISIYKIFMAKRRDELDRITLGIWLIGVLLGLIFIILNDALISILIIAIGLYLLVSGGFHLYVAIKAIYDPKDKKVKSVSSVIEIIIGLIFLLFPINTESLIIIMIGILMIYEGIETIFEVAYLRQTHHHSYYHEYHEHRKTGPNVIDHDDLTDDDIIKK